MYFIQNQRINYIHLQTKTKYMIKFLNYKSLFKGLIILFVSNTMSAQVGIRSNDENLPAGYVFPHPSAALDLYSTDRGLLLPRVNVSNPTSSTTPVASPKKGMIVYNQGTTNTPKKGIYYWGATSSSLDQYIGIYTFDETPKVATITLNNDITVLKDANSGYSFLLGYNRDMSDARKGNPSSWETIFNLDTGYLNASLQTKTSGQDQMRGVQLPAGTYTIDIHFVLNAPSTEITDRSKPLTSDSTTSSFYDMGYFSDLIYGNMSTITPTNIIVSRSEAHVTSRTDENHALSYSYTMTFIQPTFITFSIGRVDRTTYYDSAILKKDGSFIKITKLL